MTTNKLLKSLTMAVLLVSATAGPASADSYTVYSSGNVTGGYEYSDVWGYLASGPVAIPLDITPFDTTLGTLNSVTMYAEVNASGSLQAWYYGVAANLTYTLSNTLDVAEMGNTVASVAGSEPITGDPGFGAFYIFPLTANGYTIATLTSGFGRFLVGPDPFPVLLTLAGSASSSDPFMTDVYFNFDGNATISVDYDYTPVPEPGTMILLGTGVAGLVAARRRRR